MFVLSKCLWILFLSWPQFHKVFLFPKKKSYIKKFACFFIPNLSFQLPLANIFINDEWESERNTFRFWNLSSFKKLVSYNLWFFSSRWYKMYFNTSNMTGYFMLVLEHYKLYFSKRTFLPVNGYLICTLSCICKL